MKIICTKEEFAGLVRACEQIGASSYTSCSGCVFNTVCAQDGDPSDGDIMYRIEDICEIQGVTRDGN